MSKRIYLVTDTSNKRLVSASSQAQAIGHVVRAQFKATVATQSQLVELLGAGVKVEHASEELAGANPLGEIRE